MNSARSNPVTSEEPGEAAAGSDGAAGSDTSHASDVADITPNQGSVLVVEDDEIQRLALARLLRNEGYWVESVANADEALRVLEVVEFDLVVSDIDMPGRDGIALLRTVRQRDPDVPVILLTGGPRLDTAILAIEHRATRYLTKPVDHAVFRHAARVAMQASRLTRVRRDLGELAARHRAESLDPRELESNFTRALDQLFMVYQPIVRWSDRYVYAQEALVRSREPSLGNPDALFDAAELLDRVQDIGRIVRPLAAEPMLAGGNGALFVNLHTKDLADESLYDPNSPLAKMALNVVLEITERARLEAVGDVPGRIRRLRELGYRVALDDLGAGYASLTSFAALEPDIVKLDMSLVRGIHESTTKQKLVGSMIRVCVDLGVGVVGEGVECVEERDTLVALGCDLLQGYLFGRPGAAFAEVAL